MGKSCLLFPPLIWTTQPSHSSPSASAGNSVTTRFSFSILSLSPSSTSVAGKEMLYCPEGARISSEWMWDLFTEHDLIGPGVQCFRGPWLGMYWITDIIDKPFHSSHSFMFICIREGPLLRDTDLLVGGEFEFGSIQGLDHMSFCILG